MLAITACGRASSSEPAPDAVKAVVEWRSVSYEPVPGYERAVGGDGRPLYLKPEPLVAGATLLTARANFDAGGTPVIDIRFRPEAKQQIAQMAQAHIGKPIALLANGQVLTVATVAGPFADSMQLGGIGDVQEQQRMLKLLTRAPGRRMVPEHMEVEAR
ncbi:preprotein translocase subunit SecD [Xanthomonas sp. AmX2]|uniref:SecDF P1 head subdomain-containing protein n=1 Tax=Xanthomonas sp. TaxID=29446 RepID=UPI001980BFDC|nr:preprotein translocase subunit SecD [Xanthomonas sp.]MBN6149881.1 preprotein translocase subunit SecD [Xanthomonas sp.]